MKKLLALMLATALALSLAACGGDSGAGDNNTPSTGNGDTTSTDTPSGGGEDNSTPPANDGTTNDAQTLSFGDTVTTEHFEFTPVFEGFANEVANWPDENYLTPDGEFYGDNPFKASEEKTLMWFSGTVNYIGGATSNEAFTFNYKIIYDNDYEFTWNRDGCQDAYTDDIESGEWERENGRFMEFEPLSSKTVRHIRFYIEVPKQIEENTDKGLSVVFNITIFDGNGNEKETNEYIYKMK